MSLFDILDNREKAFIFWVLIFLITVTFRKTVRNSILRVLKALFHKKILLSLIAMSVYISALIILFYKINLWNITLLVDTIFWILGTAFVLLLNINKAKNKHYFKELLLDNLKIILLVEFIVNLYTFDLFAEIIIFPILCILVGGRFVAETNERYKPAKEIFDYILGAYGCLIILLSLQFIFIDIQAFLTSANLQAFIFLPLLTFAYIPFIYMIGLLMVYELLFLDIDRLLRADKVKARFAKQRLLILCNVNLIKLSEFRAENIQVLNSFNTSQDIISLISNLERQATTWKFFRLWYLRITLILLLSALLSIAPT